MEDLQNCINIRENKQKYVYIYKLKLIYTLFDDTIQYSDFGYYASEKLAIENEKFFKENYTLPYCAKNVETSIDREIVFVEY